MLSVVELAAKFSEELVVVFSLYLHEVIETFHEFHQESNFLLSSLSGIALQDRNDVMNVGLVHGFFQKVGKFDCLDGLLEERSPSQLHINFII